MEEGWARSKPATLVFHETEVEVHSKNTDAQNRWAIYSDAVETGRLYLLRHGKRKAYTVVSKRALQSSSDESTFRLLVDTP
jgi:hypothetical protein